MQILNYSFYLYFSFCIQLQVPMTLRYIKSEFKQNGATWSVSLKSKSRAFPLPTLLHSQYLFIIHNEIKILLIYGNSDSLNNNGNSVQNRNSPTYIPSQLMPLASFYLDRKTMTIFFSIYFRCKCICTCMYCMWYVKHVY